MVNMFKHLRKYHLEVAANLLSVTAKTIRINTYTSQEVILSQSVQAAVKKMPQTR